MRKIVLFMFVLVVAFGVAFAEDVSGSEKPSVSNPVINVSATAISVCEILQNIAKQAGERVLVESAVNGNIDVQLSDVPFEKALDTVCSVAKLQWRELYIAPNCDYLSQPDKLASLARLISGIGLPDVAVTASSTGKVAAYTSDTVSTSTIAPQMSAKLNMVRVYVVTDDMNVSSSAKQASKVQEYTQLAQKQLELLSQMSADELEQAMIAGLNLSEQMDASYMASIVRAMMKTDPVALRRSIARQNQLIFNMDREDRRQMLKLGMQLQSDITPEQMQILQEDTMAVLAELAEDTGQD